MGHGERGIRNFDLGLRNHGIKQAHTALFDTNEAMTQLPPDMRAEKT